jgi:mono/diheme cytochrome c family protein
MLRPRAVAAQPRRDARSRRRLIVVTALLLTLVVSTGVVAAKRWRKDSRLDRPDLEGAIRVEELLTPPPTAKDEPVEVGSVTYASDVAPIVRDKCVSCHRPGQAAPFSLLTYDNARAHSAMIREVVEQRRMPPWHADPRFGRFANDRGLSAKERATILAWVEQGAALGDPRAIPAPRRFPEGWSIGTPDVIFEMAEPFTVAAQGILPYQYIRVPTHFTEDKWVQAVEAKPGDREVVHHFIVRIEIAGKAFKHHGQQPYLVGYAPGDMPAVYEPGTAKRIPAGADLIFAVHYTPIGQVRTDRSAVGLIFAKEPVRYQAVTEGISQEKFRIPPGAADYPVRSRFTFKDDAHLISLMPHMHLRGKSFRYKATYPDGRTEVLLSVPAYDFGWQSVYRLVEPKPMPRGTRIDCLALFDNSPRNPNNPNPSQTVTWGEQTFDEMMVGFIDYRDDQPVAPAPR